MSGARILAITRRIVADFRRDHRTMALLVVVPVITSALLGWIVTAGATSLPRVVVTVADAPLRAPVEAALRSADGADIEFVATADDETSGRAMLRDDRADILLVVPAGTVATVASGGAPAMTLVTPGLDPVAESGAVARLGGVLASVFATPGGFRPPAISHETVFGSPEDDQLDALGPVFVGYFGYFFVFILTGISFLRERVGGTLERLMSTPVRRSEIIVGYSVGFGLFAALQVVVLLGFALMDLRTPAVGPLPELRLGLGVGNAGNPLLVFAVVLILGLGAVNLGILLSTFARTEFQILQFIPLVIIPQGLLGGLLWPIETLPAELEVVSRVMPMRYGIEGLRAVMVRGAGLDDPTLQVDLLVLAGLALGFVLLAARTVRREIA